MSVTFNKYCFHRPRHVHKQCWSMGLWNMRIQHANMIRIKAMMVLCIYYCLVRGTYCKIWGLYKMKMLQIEKLSRTTRTTTVMLLLFVMMVVVVTTDEEEHHKHADTLRPIQHGCYFAYENFSFIFLYTNVCSLIKMSLRYVFNGQINDEPALLFPNWRRAFIWTDDDLVYRYLGLIWI